MKLLIRLTGHGGWSSESDVFDENQTLNDPGDPWSLNCSIGRQLFGNEKRFCDNIEGYRIQKNELKEFFIYILSGGVVAPPKTINLPRNLLNVIHKLDHLLIRIAPNFFALGRSVVLEKK